MENEMTLVDAAVENVDDFNPDGLDEIVALLRSDSSSPESFATDGPAKTPEDLNINSDGGNSETPSATPAGENEEPLTKSTETTEPAKEPDGEPESVKKPRVLKLKVDREDRELDLNAMDESEIASIMQKGYAFDRMKAQYDALRDKESQATYRKVYNEQLDDGMTESVARLVAKEAAGGKTYSLDKDIEIPVDSDVEVIPEDTITVKGSTQEPPSRDFKAEYAKLKVLYPELETVPSEVVDVAMNNDISIVESYQAFLGHQRSKTVAAENAALKKENNILKQNEASAARAPVTGVSGGGAISPKRDLWLEGFESTY